VRHQNFYFIFHISAESNWSGLEDDDHLLDQVLRLPKTIPSVGVNQVIRIVGIIYSVVYFFALLFFTSGRLAFTNLGVNHFYSTVNKLIPNPFYQ